MRKIDDGRIAPRAAANELRTLVKETLETRDAVNQIPTDDQDLREIRRVYAETFDEFALAQRKLMALLDQPGEVSIPEEPDGFEVHLKKCREGMEHVSALSSAYLKKHNLALKQPK